MVLVCGALCVLLAAVSAWGQDPSPAETVFHKQIEPILVSRCLTCHGGDRKGGLDLRTRETALAGGKTGVVLIPGDVEASLLAVKVRAGEMPPDVPLADDEIALLTKWIADGAFFPDTPLDLFAATTEKRAGYDWWALQPLDPGPLPSVEASDARWNDSPIDRYVLARLKDEGLAPSAPADPRTLIRRATYDLHGLPPTPEEVAAFVQDCANETGSPEAVGDRAYAALLERLLASPHYGEQWGRHWLDVVRFGESTGYEVNHIIDNLWPYRDYIIESFNSDKPFDRLVLEQLAGDALAPDDPAVQIGMAFLVCGPHDIVGNQDPAQAAQIRADAIDEMIRVTSESFLGLTMGCARCHDHKFDPIAQRDYYQMYATFAGVSHGNRVVAPEAQRREYETKTQPLIAKRDAQSSRVAALIDAIVSRAETKAGEYDALWPRTKVSRHGTEETFAPVEARFLRFVSEGLDANPDAAAGYKLDEFEVWSSGEDTTNVAAASAGGKAVGASRVAEDFGGAYQADAAIDGKFGVSWIAQAPELTLEFKETARIDRVVFSSDRPAALPLDSGETVFVCDYRIEVSTDGATWTEVANSHDRAPVNDRHRKKRLFQLEATAEEKAQRAALEAELASTNAELATIPPLPQHWVGVLNQPPAEMHVFLGGDPQRKGDAVVPAALSAFLREEKGYTLPADAPEQKRRVALANWIVSEDNPLTPRVLVNRVWHGHFGTGIVSTPSDFGYMGGRPSHPELLDWLARELMAPSEGEGASPGQAWRLKRMHKLIMLSQAYRQASTYRAEPAAIDADSRLLWRYPPRRLSAEAIRDTMLALAGKLDPAMGGPGYRLYDYLRDNVSTYIPLDKVGPETYRRAVYHQNVRASRIDVLTDFDFPDCAMSTPRRVATTSPLQALTLMNHSFTMDMANFMTERLQQDVEARNTGAMVDRAFRLAFNRPADGEEAAAALDLIEAYGMPAFCRALLNANELIYVN